MDEVRQQLHTKENECIGLKHEVESWKTKRPLSQGWDPPSSATRPDTSGTDLALRQSVLQPLEQFGGTSSATLNAIWNLPPSQCEAYLRQKKAVRTGNSRWDALGCWVNRGSNQTGSIVPRPAINLRNSNREDDPTKVIGANPKLYQLAMVVQGQGRELREGCHENGGFEVGHLCHNNGCFKPEHLVIETVADNKARNQCGPEACNWKLPDGSIIMTCTHWNLGAKKFCLLPTKSIPYSSTKQRWRLDANQNVVAWNP